MYYIIPRPKRIDELVPDLEAKAGKEVSVARSLLPVATRCVLHMLDIIVLYKMCIVVIIIIVIMCTYIYIYIYIYNSHTCLYQVYYAAFYCIAGAPRTRPRSDFSPYHIYIYK